ncbi:MAG TPA: ABC transporter ATP-binding protein [Fimbriimonas sp.]
MVPLLECRSLSCGYHGHPVLEKIDLAVSPGESVALLGPNGSGKSTLLRTVGKLIPPLEGSALLGGDDVRGLSHEEVARRVAHVPQEEATDFPFLVREIVGMGRIPHAKGLMDSPEDMRKTEEAMATADCADLAERPITELSGGERQRVLIARALAQESPFMLLDEPTSHLDVRHQLEVASLIRRLTGVGRTVLAAVHDLNLASFFADRGVLLQNGTVALDAPMREVLESDRLDRAYGVRFVRQTDAEGTLRVFGVR